jgi:hypothetical protein
MLGFPFRPREVKEGVAGGGPSMFAWAVWRSRSPSIVRARALITDQPPFTTPVLLENQHPTDTSPISFDDQCPQAPATKRSGPERITTHGTQ